jgi:hypothetical protein
MEFDAETATSDPKKGFGAAVVVSASRSDVFGVASFIYSMHRHNSDMHLWVSDHI